MDDRSSDTVILVTFHSVSSALYLETLLKQRRIQCGIIPVPRELSSSCGYALEIAMIEGAELQKIMGKAIEWERVYRDTKEQYQLLAQA